MKGPSHADGVACRAVMHTGLLMTLARRGMGARRQGLVVSAACMLESVDSAPVLTPNRGHQSCTLSQSSAHPVCEANVRGAWHSRIQQPVGDGNEIVGCGCPNSNALTVLISACATRAYSPTWVVRFMQQPLRCITDVAPLPVHGCGHTPISCMPHAGPDEMKSAASRTRYLGYTHTDQKSRND